MVCGPGFKVLIEKLACPLAFNPTTLASVVAPSLKVTDPVVTALPALNTVAVKVILALSQPGLLEEDNDVVVIPGGII